MAGAAAPQELKTTRRAQCGMDTTGLRHRLRRAGGLRSRPGRRGAAQLRRAARIALRHGRQGARADPARCSRRTPARSPARGGVTGARLASHAGQVSTLAQIALRRRARGAARALRRRARGVALANHARSRGLRYGGHSNNSSWISMSKGVALGCLSSVLALIDGGSQPRCTTRSSMEPPGHAGVGGALLRTPMAVRPLAAGKVRALPSHRQAGNSGCGAGGAAARRGRVWGACRHGRALRKM